MQKKLPNTEDPKVLGNAARLSDLLGQIQHWFSVYSEEGPRAGFTPNLLNPGLISRLGWGLDMFIFFWEWFIQNFELSRKKCGIKLILDVSI